VGGFTPPTTLINGGILEYNANDNGTQWTFNRLVILGQFNIGLDYFGDEK
jgi:hypothetical protein